MVHWRERFINCECIIADGDFNVDLSNCHDDVRLYINSLMNAHRLSRCVNLSQYCGQPTYVNLASNHQSCMDLSNITETSCFEILDPDINSEMTSAFAATSMGAAYWVRRSRSVTRVYL